MIDPQLLEILRCPQDRSSLTFADATLVEKVNQQILTGKLTNISGQPVKEPIDGGMLRAAGDLLYPIVSGIPVMLYDEAIDVTQLS
ncbi:Trm112 family protein [Bythopirellula polymerisocia]|uniref:Trm112p-like protein n=1 Tax=Bythopirellula polymerisocia TaxID=2528003 RepID=A0A5C6D091_9BACT|nr:Trm112 family protein [Bythopirellula polymerisocia]TWU30543.1 hypothetical protein Pla144_13310 [Bythopirellula polymerisocia]